jgi:uncharacterized protein (TIGR00255 family)
MSQPAETPIRSMTGFAQVRGATKSGEVTISLRSVNHRGLDLHFHMASDLLIFENAIRAALKQAVARGHVEIRASLQPAAGSLSSYDREAVSNYLAAFRQAAAEHGIAQQPDLNVALSQGRALDRVRETETLDSSLEPEVLAILERCLTELNVHREREGAALTKEFLREAAGIDQSAGEIAAIRTTALPQLQQRLRDRLSELLGHSGISDTRLAEEAAILTDRSDIQEELTRLQVHIAELRRILAAGGEIGKRLDFLLQELNREANTILSKTSGVGETGLTITKLALGIKAHIEKIREQALNIE